MSAALPDPIPLLRTPPRRPAGAPARRVELALVVAAAVAVLAAIAYVTLGAERGLRGVPAEQRAAILARTLDELRQSCGAEPPDALKEHCRELASFAAQFDECGGECASLVRRQLAAAPTR